MMDRRTKQIAGVVAVAGAIAAGWFLGALGAAAWVLALALLAGGLEVLGHPGKDEPKVAVRGSFWVGLLLPLGLGLLFVAERVIGEGHEHLGWWRVLALTALGAAVAWRAWELWRSSGKKRAVELRLAVATGGVLAALGVYALSTDWGTGLLGLEDAAAERASGALGVLWVALLVVSAGALWFMEMAYRRMPVDEAIELRRVSAAAGNGLALALSLVFVASINFVANQRDEKWDLSYFRTTRPSETSLSMVRRLDEPVRVVLFFPSVNEVLEQVRPYFEELAAASDELTVEAKDHALAPDLAREHRVRGNGFVLLLRGEGEGQQAESFEVGADLEAARRRLRTLDGRFQEHFARLTIRPRDLHLTSGHGERSARGDTGDGEGERLGQFEAALSRSNIESRQLGVAQGLANQVPEDARAVAVIGPREPFLPEEAESLLRYVQGGGRLVVFVDPGVDHGLDPLLNGLGLALQEGVLHSERHHLRHGEPPADRQVIYSNHYSAHPTVTLANRYRSRVASLFDRGGALSRHEGEGALAGINVTFPLRTPEGYWLDRDGDHERDEGEPADERFHLMAAVTVSAGENEGRAVVIADGDFITDKWIGNQGNHFILMDVLNWLVGEDQVLGPTTTEEDREIRLTKDEDKLLFYGTSFGAPLPLLLVGIWLTVRRRRGGERSTSRVAEGSSPSVITVAGPAPEASSPPEPESDTAPEAAPNGGGSSEPRASLAAGAVNDAKGKAAPRPTPSSSGTAEVETEEGDR